MSPLAHLGHWSTTLAVAVPPAAVLLWVAVITLRDRRRARREPRGH